MNGLATRKALADIAAHCAPCAEHPTPDRRGALLLGYKRYADDEEIPAPTYLPNAHGLGTPMEAERVKAGRRERFYDRAFRIGGALIVILVALGGYGWHERKSEPVKTGVAYRLKAQTLAAGRMACEPEPYEGCLVCMHKDASGLPVVSTHC